MPYLLDLLLVNGNGGSGSSCGAAGGCGHAVAGARSGGLRGGVARVGGNGGDMVHTAVNAIIWMVWRW